MIINQPNLQFFFTGVETRFWSAYSAVPVVYSKIATVYPVGTEQWVSGWLGMLNKAREWVGPRVTRTPAPYSYLVPIQLFELTESIDQFRLADDTYGIYDPVIAHMATQMAKLADYQIRDMLQNSGSQTGTRQKGFDAKNFFATDHPVAFYDSSLGTYINDFSAGGQSVDGHTVGGALAPNAFASVYQYMGTLKSESGETWGIQPDLAMAGARLKFALDTILQAQFMGLPVIGSIGTGISTDYTSAATSVPNAPLVGASSNALMGWADRLIWPDLGSATSIGGGTYHDLFYLLDTKKPIKPISWLQRQAPDFTYRIQPDDPVVFDTHSYVYGSKARGAPAWSLPVLMARSGP